MRAPLAGAVATIVWAASASAVHAAPEWEVVGSVLDGRQFAAVADGTAVHVIGERYLQIDAGGNVVADESDVSDDRQGALDFYPAVAVAVDGSVHIVTRHGGDFDSGHEIRYTRRAPGGGWDTPIVVGSPVGRNYVVGVAAPSGGRIVVAHSHAGADVGSTIDLYEIGGGTANGIGSVGQGWVRADNDFRLRTMGNAVFLAAGDPGPDGSTHVGFAGDGDGDLAAQWEATKVSLRSGSGRRGGPDLDIGDEGDVHVLYGAESALFYARFTPDGSAVGAEAQAMDDLGTWHLSHGNGALTVSADGMRVLAVGLQNLDGDQTSADADVLWAESTDAGATFSEATAIGVQSDGGEGRQRPRLLRLGDTVLLVFYDSAAAAVALAVADWSADDPGGTGSGDGGSGSTGGGDEGGDTTGDPGNGDGGGEGNGDDGPPPTSAGTSGGGTLDLPPGGRSGASGCACRSPGDGPLPPLALLALFGRPLRRRRS